MPHIFLKFNFQVQELGNDGNSVEIILKESSIWRKKKKRENENSDNKGLNSKQKIKKNLKLINIIIIWFHETVVTGHDERKEREHIL